MIPRLFRCHVQMTTAEPMPREETMQLIEK